MFKILGSDGKEYGPIDATIVREWIRERRANGKTRIQVEGQTEWVELASLVDFAPDLAAASAPPPLPPRLGAAPAAASSSASATGPKTSGMAIASLVLGLVGFCGVTAIMGMILGLVSLIKIGKSNGQLKGKGLAISGMILSSLMFIVFLGAAAGVLLPALSKAKYQRQFERDRPQYSDCGVNVRKLALAIRLYADEHEGKCPPAARWCDDLLANVEGKHIFDCPQRRGSPGAYGFNAKLAGRTISASPPDTVMIFETDKGWNTTGGAGEVIAQPSHGRNFVFGFADGSVREVTAEELAELRWEP